MPTHESRIQTIAAYSERAQKSATVLRHLIQRPGLDARPHGAIVAKKVIPERERFLEVNRL